MKIFFFQMSNWSC